MYWVSLVMPLCTRSMSDQVEKYSEVSQSTAKLQILVVKFSPFRKMPAQHLQLRHQLIPRPFQLPLLSHPII
jgi:hypothetical protein